MPIVLILVVFMYKLVLISDPFTLNQSIGTVSNTLHMRSRKKMNHWLENLAFFPPVKFLLRNLL